MPGGAHAPRYRPSALACARPSSRQAGRLLQPRLFRIPQVRAQYLSRLEQDCLSEGTPMLAIAERIEFQLDVIPRLERAARPADAREIARARELHRPNLRRRTRLGWSFHPQHHMRVGAEGL